MENMLKKPADSELSSSMDDDSAGREEGGKQKHVEDVEWVSLFLTTQYK